jgi:hypothetical protein
VLLDDNRINKLTGLIKDSFRVRPNQDPIYVDIGDHLSRLAAKQHQVIFGRRGSGKSCLLVHYHRTRARDPGVLTIYIEADEVKMLPYPDILIRLLLSIGEELRSKSSTVIGRFLRRSSQGLRNELRVLRALLDEAEVAKVSRDVSGKSSASAGVHLGPPGSTVDAELSGEEAARRTTEFTARKIDTLQRHLQDYKVALVDAIGKSRFDHAAVILDDFYLIKHHYQPDVIDYLHRLLRGTELYLKVGTVRHRTALVRHNGAQTVGVELAQDVEEINLDQTFEDIDATKRYLTRMLDSMAANVGLNDFSETHFSDEGLLALTLASGGVPRDFLTIFVEAVKAARDTRAKRLTPKSIYRGAGRVSYRTKLINLRSDVGAEATGLEMLFTDLTTYCLREKRKTAFLVSQEDATKYRDEHELIQQLMDFKVIHVIEPDTSAASGRSGRYEAYTLDFALFMEPRLRNIEHAEFWKIDDQRRRRGLREAPVYSLERARQVLARGTTQSVEQTISGIQADAGIEDSADGGPDDEQV